MAERRAGGLGGAPALLGTPIHRSARKVCMKGRWRSPDGRSSVAPILITGQTVSGLDTVRWTPEGCGMKTLSENSPPGATDNTTISTTVAGGGREAHALLQETTGANLPSARNCTSESSSFAQMNQATDIGVVSVTTSAGTISVFVADWSTIRESERTPGAGLPAGPPGLARHDEVRQGRFVRQLRWHRAVTQEQVRQRVYPSGV